jgi:mycoredoxin-dependent peroxiredoxin
MAVEVGDKAPDFTLKDQHGQAVTLSDFRGEKNVVIIFYPFAFTGVCTGELCAVRDELAAFENDNVQVLSISIDSVFSHRVFAEQENLPFPLLSDFWPHGEVCRAYDVFDERTGAARRSSYVIDKQGTLRWAVHNASSEGRDLDEHLRQLTAIV